MWRVHVGFDTEEALGCPAYVCLDGWNLSVCMLEWNGTFLVSL